MMGFLGGATDTDPVVSPKEKAKHFLSVHWRGIVTIVTPIICLFIVLPGNESWQWCAYTLVVMAVYWVSECIPLPVTGFLPVLVFPLTGVMSARAVASCYLNDTVVLFLATIFLAYAIEQSGVHERLALNGITIVGYSHYRLLFTISFLTMFVSMWITNTAATTMFVPFIFAVLKVFEEEKLLSVYKKNADGSKEADILTVCYFCACTFSATIGGIGTLIGTGTNLVFKQLFMNQYPKAPEYYSFPMYSAFAIPYMLVMEFTLYVSFCVIFLGFLRPKSAAAKRAHLSEEAKMAAQNYVESELKRLGKMKWREYMALILFFFGICLFFSRSPQMFQGWGDAVEGIYGAKGVIKDSVIGMMVSFLMFMTPGSLDFFYTLRTKFREDLKPGPLVSVLDYNKMNLKMPWSFMFLLGGGFALSTGAGKQYSDLNQRVGDALQVLQPLPKPLVLLLMIIVTVLITNFASNVAVCNVISPIAMTLATNIGMNPLYLNLATGVACSFCFCIPVGTPGNLIVQSAAKVPTTAMIRAGIIPTILIIIWTELFMLMYSPIIWPIMKDNVPDWIK